MRALLALLSLSLLPVLAQASAQQTVMTQTDSDRLIAAGKAAAQAQQAHVCIAVVDQSGLLLAFGRMDDAAPGCVDASILKARAAALYRTSTARFMDRANAQEPAIATLPGMVPLGGGTPVQIAGKVVGAVGVSGATGAIETKISEQAAAGIGGPAS
ncbi:heme-binding protein [Pseudomonas sp. dw_358]|uniref:GlcG/HbpS family heme-binding protein n=1 Tax=Pseudomonas sp. dw_358 TaxID=2720083 RepID=UPI001BD293A3|nr:heme-binding protein [Pseudomonas sp. dw_358]